MKEMRIMRAIGDIDDRYIDEAAPVIKSKAVRFGAWARYAGMAAAAVLVIGAGVFVITRGSDVGVSDPAQTSAAPVGSTDMTEGEPIVIMSAAEDTDSDFSAAWSSPYMEYDTMEEASQTAGFDMTVPESFGIYADRHIATVFDDMIEVTYYDEAGNEGFRVRKTAGADDPSGDFNVYESSETADVDGRTVTMEGSSDKIFKAVWTDSGYAYAVSAGENGLSRADIEEIIKNVK